ncbi:MAG: glycosyltransferase [Candidatus Eisenbacteria bacterium]|nr:glycosyltransferase [Candidatus Eisenbacteria bacterium]
MNRKMRKRVPLSVIIIARNEADRLPRTLASLAWAEQVVLVDSGSEDGTVERAREAGAEVHTHPWRGYGAQKQIALARARHDWVLSVDADEVVSTQLRASIEALLASTPRHTGYTVNRRTHYLGRFIRYGGWYPDRKLRLFRRECARFDGRLVHEGVRVSGTIGHLRGDLHHYSYRNLSHHARKTHEMAVLWAAQQPPGARARVWHLIAHPLAKLFKSYCWRGGMWEGWRGLLIAGMGAYSVWLKYALLRERQECASLGARWPEEEGADRPTKDAAPHREGRGDAGAGKVVADT